MEKQRQISCQSYFDKLKDATGIKSAGSTEPLAKMMVEVAHSMTPKNEALIEAMNGMVRVVPGQGLINGGNGVKDILLWVSGNITNATDKRSCILELLKPGLIRYEYYISPEMAHAALLDINYGENNDISITLYNSKEGLNPGDSEVKLGEFFSVGPVEARLIKAIARHQINLDFKYSDDLIDQGGMENCRLVPYAHALAILVDDGEITAEYANQFITQVGLLINKSTKPKSVYQNPYGGTPNAENEADYVGRLESREEEKKNQI